MDLPAINLTKMIVSVSGAALAAYHASRRTSDMVWMFVAGNLFNYGVDGLIQHYLQPQWHIAALVFSGLFGAFLIREIVAYSDKESATIIKTVMGKLRRRAESGESDKS